MTTFNPDEYQAAVMDATIGGTGSYLVNACPGGGKTTTVVEAANRLPQGTRAMFLAFGKDIAKEMAGRLPRGFVAKTFHSAGLAAWVKKIGGRVNYREFIDGDKMKPILRSLDSEIEGDVFGVVLKVVSSAKNAGYVPAARESDWWNLGTIEDALPDLLDEHGDALTPSARERAGELAIAALTRSIDLAEEVIDFDDMIYMPMIEEAPFFRNDLVIVDEVQDLNGLQHIMIGRLLAPGGRLVGVGDDRQAIYAFRGADSRSMESLAAMYDATWLPMSVSYRCPKRVVAEADKVVPGKIVSAPTAPEGVVETLATWGPERFAGGEAILCRNNAPLMATYWKLLAGGVSVLMLGREADVLTSFIKRLKGKTIEDLLTRLDRFEERESEKLRKKDRPTEALNDKCECVRVLVAALPENRRTIPALVSHVTAMFDPRGKGKNPVVLSSVHKAKGQEWDRVYLLDRGTLMPSPYAKTEEARTQEDNLIYVAVTRAKAELYYVASDDFRG